MSLPRGGDSAATANHLEVQYEEVSGLYLAPAKVIEEWKRPSRSKGRRPKKKMQADWKKWVTDHAKMFADMGAGVGKTKRVATQGVSCPTPRNDIMLYAIVEADSTMR